MARGAFNILMVWADNRDGDFDIYSMFLDAVGVKETPTPVVTPAIISVERTVFTDVLKIHLSAAAAGGTVIIHDALGRVVRRLQVEGRSGSCVWDGRGSRGDDAGEGVYFVSLAGKTISARLKVIKIK
jgi:flagellar hook assembly protein FlgD